MTTPIPPVERYRSPADLPGLLPVFPLTGVLLLPRAQLPLTIFEPRYLTMVDHAMAGTRLIGMIQPAPGESDAGTPPMAPTGTVGRITSYTENDDGRYYITLTGICRFKVEEEPEASHPFRLARVSYEDFGEDFVAGSGEDGVDRQKLLDMFRAYLDARNLEVDWHNVHNSSTETLVNALSMMSPYGPGEKQAMLEAPDLGTRAELLIALTEMELRRLDADSGATLQ